MKLKSILKSITYSEILVVLIFIIYLVLPVSTPKVLSPYIESPLGMFLIFCITVFLFIGANPVLAVLFVFVSYTLLRRSAGGILPSASTAKMAKFTAPPNVTGQATYVQYTATDEEKKAEIAQEVAEVNPPPQQPYTLEEQVISKMAPVGKSETPIFTPSTFKPVSTNIGSASII